MINSLSELYLTVSQKLPGVSSAILDTEFRRAEREACREAGIWSEEFTFDVVDDVYIYPIALPTNTDLSLCVRLEDGNENKVDPNYFSVTFEDAAATDGYELTDASAEVEAGIEGDYVDSLETLNGAKVYKNDLFALYKAVEGVDEISSLYIASTLADYIAFHSPAPVVDITDEVVLDIAGSTIPEILDGPLYTLPAVNPGLAVVLKYEAVYLGQNYSLIYADFGGTFAWQFQVNDGAFNLLLYKVFSTDQTVVPVFTSSDLTTQDGYVGTAPTSITPALSIPKSIFPKNYYAALPPISGFSGILAGQGDYSGTVRSNSLSSQAAGVFELAQRLVDGRVNPQTFTATFALMPRTGFSSAPDPVLTRYSELITEKALVRLYEYPPNFPWANQAMAERSMTRARKLVSLAKSHRYKGLRRTSIVAQAPYAFI